MTSKRVYIYFALTFLLGILAGGAGAFFVGKRPPEPPGSPVRRERILRRMTRELDLNDKQAQQIRAIMEDAGGKMESLRTQHRPEFDAVRATARDEIRKLLSPEQTRKFDEMVRKVEERRKKLRLPD